MSDDAAKLLGTTLADTYIIDSQLGEGGMGTVYLARHTRIAAKRFAVKVLHEEFAQHGEALERFKREAEATASISSPHVIGVHDVGTTPDGRPFIASDFLDGEELADRLDREGGQLPVEEALRIVKEVCTGLAAAHAQGVVHRDVKPENVFLVNGPHGTTVKLLDFGISRLTDKNQKALTQAGIALGTPDFMSPEQARGKPVDHRSDVYAAGVLLYVMLCGVSPFERSSPQETLMALLTEEAPPLTELEPTLPRELVAIVDKAIAKEVEGRYQTAEELLAALNAFDPNARPEPPEPTAPMNIPAAPVPVTPTMPDEQPVEMVPVAPYAGVGILAAFLGLWLAVGGVLRIADVDVGFLGWLIVAVLLAIAVAIPGGLAVAHVNRPSSQKPRRTRAVRSGVLIGCVAYALGALLVRVLQIALLDDPDGIAWPVWDMLLFVVASAAAGIAAARTT